MTELCQRQTLSKPNFANDPNCSIKPGPIAAEGRLFFTRLHIYFDWRSTYNVLATEYVTQDVFSGQCKYCAREGLVVKSTTIILFSEFI
jgi:hypothetical protein